MYYQVSLVHTPCYEIMDDRLEPPLGLLYLATFLNQNGYKVRIIDLSSVPEPDWKERIPEADVYGFSTFSPTYQRTLQIKQIAYKKKSIRGHNRWRPSCICVTPRSGGRFRLCSGW